MRVIDVNLKGLIIGPLEIEEDLVIHGVMIGRELRLSQSASMPLIRLVDGVRLEVSPLDPRDYRLYVGRYTVDVTQAYLPPSVRNVNGKLEFRVDERSLAVVTVGDFVRDPVHCWSSAPARTEDLPLLRAVAVEKGFGESLEVIATDLKEQRFENF